MIKSSVLAAIGAITFAFSANVHHVPPSTTSAAPQAVMEQAPAKGQAISTAETISVYYQPLPATEFAKYVGVGLAHHMTIVYTNRLGVSYAASSGPSNLSTPQTIYYMYTAFTALAGGKPSSYGSLVAYRQNNTPFVVSAHNDLYTQDGQHTAYRHTQVMYGNDLSLQWATIVRTYTAVDKLHLTYSPLNQNSNSLAGTALSRAGVDLKFSKTSAFAPGVFTRLPVGQGYDLVSAVRQTFN